MRDSFFSALDIAGEVSFVVSVKEEGCSWGLITKRPYR